MGSLKSDEENVKRIDLNEDAGELEIELGIAGCPEDIRQVVLFLDVDTEDIEDGDIDVSDFAWIDLRRPRNGELWIDEVPERIPLNGDCRLYATLIGASGEVRTIHSWIGDALDRYYFLEKWHDLQDQTIIAKVQEAISRLRSDGSRRTSGNDLGPSR